MERITKLLSYLRTLPRWARIIAVFVVAALSVIVLFTSCGVLKNINVEDMRLGANGNVSKEKTVTKTSNTKWYAEPMPYQDEIE